MKSQFLPETPFPSVYTILLLTLFIQFPSILGNNTEWYTSCTNLFSCGGISGVDYPFWGGNRPQECGHPGLELMCEDSTPTMEIMNVKYRVLQVNPSSQILRITRNEFAIKDICPEKLVNTTLDANLFEYASGYVNLTIQYGCPSLNIPVPAPIACNINGITYRNVYVVPGAQGPGTCRASIFFPIHSTAFGGITEELSILGQVMVSGFEVRWKVDSMQCNECRNSNGRCGYDLKSNQFTCLCPGNQASGHYGCTSTSSDENGSPHESMVVSGSKSGPGTPVVLAIVGAVLAGVGLGWLIFWCRQRRRRLAAAKAAESYQTQSKDNSTTPASKAPTSVPSTVFTKSIPSYPSSKTEFGKDSSYFGVQVFSYGELEEATDGFSQSRELGDGGFGAVYYGVLTDGRVVAVKRLYENNFKRVEQFINEVEILTRLRHPNLVTLFGCTSKRSRELLLVYEYIPNGTVADHLHGKRASSGLLSWPVRLNIAIETADALAYLHKSDIIHRDVKTNNILLDNDFHVKVADFGLSRLFPNDVTHVSTAPQGTPGYVDPEYYQCYQLTEKSDVYSFGVVLIELISSLQAVDTNRHRHDINLANMAVNKIQNHTLHELVDSSLEFGTNSPMRRMTTLVAELAFRCLQQERDMRPSMQEVVDALRGIQNEGLSTAKVEVVHILVDDVAPLKDNVVPTSPDSVVPDKWLSSSTPNSSG
ncbi:LEAF RUST 10 DISEASE-RESISTANCE LOCUS RECEPTOR-LIKE PROTEIN KINASE-like 1.4 isoform X1 [Coffea eugenioides]|uniref:LEAF RUST 10 DISEASE-RESISTANCE LOCUS RECEPTOR-LIKE PROTEIN KINASE-like 1.4 isoform X1 n=1 Tax=Coffea eugenioides TaxID=49369 RepID=UPI000F610A14|nr:LEAF RUST 10 DISEASE-RESISTANCE LOCUS RECEPTOR-LIKE PROTEIN KINASE-like 1.4 isoform X1 [Coffea eugenioides]